MSRLMAQLRLHGGCGASLVRAGVQPMDNAVIARDALVGQAVVGLR